MWHVNNTDGIGSISSNTDSISNISTVDSCEFDTKGEMVAHATFLSVVLALTMLGNFMVIGTIVTNQKLRTVTNYFVISLAVSDILVGLITLPLKIDQMKHNKKWCHGFELCTAWIIADIICNCASIWNLVLISIDRVLAISYPFHYREMMPRRRAILLIVLIWCGSILMACLGTLNWTFPGKQHVFTNFSCQKGDRVYYTVAAVVGFFLPLIIILICYGVVFSIALSQAKAVAAISQTSGRRSSIAAIHFIREFKAGKTLAIVVGAFIICWFPFFVILLVSLWSPLTFHQWRLNNALAFEFVDIIFIYFLTSINSAVNPFIYALFNTELRRGFLRFFFKLIRVQDRMQNSVEAPSSTSLTLRRRSSAPYPHSRNASRTPV